MTAEHKAAISAGLKRYWASRRGSGGGSSSSGTSTHLETGKQISRADAGAIMHGKRTPSATKKLAPQAARKVPSAAKGSTGGTRHLETGKTISRAAAASIMFGSKAAAKKLAKSNSARKRK